MVADKKAKKSDIKRMKAGTKYTDRNTAIKKKLQLDIHEFRRLCILKGIYPHDIKGRHGKTLYLTSDIQWLATDPLLFKMREMKSQLRKVTRYESRKEHEHAQSLQEALPVFTLDHLIRERYPTFKDALVDLPDALNMIHLFATMPSNDEVSQKAALSCQRLAREWQAYVAATHSVSKAFVSVRGVYLQTTVDDTPITWVAPHEFTQEPPTDVDFKVMATFLDLYITLVGFVLYRLYTRSGLTYPPTIDAEKDASGEWLDAIEMGEPTDTATDDAPADLEAELQILHNLKVQGDEEEYATRMARHMEAQDDARVPHLFTGLKFHLARGVPTRVVALVIKACGGVVVEDPEAADLQLSERPGDSELRKLVPQWLFDSLNFRMLMPADEYTYSPDAAIPPHLSPFDDYTDPNVHVPERYTELRTRWGALWTERFKTEEQYKNRAFTVPDMDAEEIREVTEEELNARVALTSRKTRNLYQHVKAAHDVKKDKQKKLKKRLQETTDKEKKERKTHRSTRTKTSGSVFKN